MCYGVVTVWLQCSYCSGKGAAPRNSIPQSVGVCRQDRQHTIVEIVFQNGWCPVFMFNIWWLFESAAHDVIEMSTLAAGSVLLALLPLAGQHSLVAYLCTFTVGPK